MKKEKKENITISVPSVHNKLIKEVLKNVNSNEELKAIWKVINVNAIDRLKMSDHGPTHFQIVANIALKLSRILKKNNIELSITKDFGLSQNYGELVILLASLFHDLGMSISRAGHEEYSLILANDILKPTLDFLPIEERVIVSSEALHAIISHRTGGEVNTIEAGIVRVADALDMTKGRARTSYEFGNVDIYNLSEYAIDSVEIKEGNEKMIDIEIILNNSAGLFRVDELLKKKLKGSGLEDFIKVKAIVKGESEKSLLKEFVIS